MTLLVNVIILLFDDLTQTKWLEVYINVEGEHFKHYI